MPLTFRNKMNTTQINAGLSQAAERNKTLQYLYDSDIDLGDTTLGLISEIISEPNSVDNSNAFASLLAYQNHENFIPPLIESISEATPGESEWLADYMYALIELLSELEDYYEVEDSFVHLLGDWLLSTGGGEISWKSGDILCDIQSPVSREYFFLGAVDTSLFHMTRISCLRGVINHYRDDAPELLSKLVGDSDSNVKEAALDAQAFVSQQ